MKRKDIKTERHHWQPAEDAILELHYLALGPKRCSKMLVGRSPKSCASRAILLNLRRRGYTKAENDRRDKHERAWAGDKFLHRLVKFGEWEAPKVLPVAFVFDLGAAA